MNKTIIYIGGELPDKEASALRIMANAKALDYYGFNLCLIGQRDGLQENMVIKEYYDGMKAFLLPNPNSVRTWINELINIKNLTDIISNEQNVCAVIMYNPHAFIFEKMKKYCESRDIKLIADCTEWHTVYHLSGIKKYIKLFDITRRIKISQKKADGLIAISSFFESFYREYCTTILVPPLVDLKEDKWKTSDYDSSETKRFVYAGRMGIGKDSLNSCVRAFKDFLDKDFILDIVGVSVDEYVGQFPADAEFIEKLGNRIVFHGMLPHQDALEYVKKASFSFLIRENNRKNDSGFPTKFVESIGCGTPVIASDFSDVKFYVEKYNLGIMIDRIENISLGIEKALDMSTSDYLSMRDSCINTKEFDYRSYSKKLGDFILELYQ